MTDANPANEPEQQELFPPLHYSLQRRRLMRKHPTNPERIYAAEWWRWNRRNGGWRLLEHILDPDKDYGQRWPYYWRAPPVVTRRDAVVAACVVQWLATNVGSAFVWECEKKVREAETCDDVAEARRKLDVLRVEKTKVGEQLQQRLANAQATLDYERARADLEVAQARFAEARERWRERFGLATVELPVRMRPRGIML